MALCGSEFWNSSVTWYTDNPDFTPCFQKTLLTWLPCVYMGVGVIPYYLYRSKYYMGHINMSLLHKVRMFFMALLVVVSVVQSIVAMVNMSDVDVHRIDVISPAVVCLTFIIVIVVIHFERLRGCSSSAFLFLFWFLFVIVDIVILRSLCMTAVHQGAVSNVPRFSLFVVHFILLLIQLVLSAFNDNKPLFSSMHDEPNCIPEDTVSFLSGLTFWWFTSLIIKGYKKSLEQVDLWTLNPPHRARNVSPIFQSQWQKELSRAHASKDSTTSRPSTTNQSTGVRYQPGPSDEVEGDVLIKSGRGNPPGGYKPSLFKALWRAHALPLLLTASVKFIFDLMQFIGPNVLQYLLKHISDDNSPSWRGYFFVFILLISDIIKTLILHIYFNRCSIQGMHIKTSLMDAIYKKSLLLSNTSRRESTIGEIVNLMSVDAQRFLELTTYIHIIWSGPLQMILSIYFLWQLLGPSILAGVAVMILLLPINAKVATYQKKIQVKTMREKDGRMKLMNEILNGMKVLKLYAWEIPFQGKILEVRKKELKYLKQTKYISAIYTFTWTCAPFMVSLATFAVYIFSSPDNVLDAEKAFVSLSLFNILRFPMSILPSVISSVIQVLVSMKRIQKFLLNSELEEGMVSHDVNTKHSITVENASFTWEPSKQNVVLRNINLQIRHGSLVAIVGHVGCGKSSFVSALLGEMDKLEGNVNLQGSVAYVPQQAWIQNALLRDNITFNRPLDGPWYCKTIEGCALVPDLALLPAGDMTEIGEKGINLSGGQKQRVSLARAVYSRSNVYLFDDPLSAVDANVGKHIFDKVIGPNGLLQAHTRVLVTNNTTFLPLCDNVIVLSDGEISEQGSYSELMENNENFAEFIKNYSLEHNEDEPVYNPEMFSINDDVLSVEGSKFIVGNAESKPSTILRSLSQISKESNQDTELGEDDSIVMNPLNVAQGSEILHPGTPLLHRARSTSSIENRSTGGHHRRLSESGGTNRKITFNKVDSIMEIDRHKDEEPAEEKGTELCRRGPNRKNEDKLIQAEVAATGRVKSSVYLSYLNAMYKWIAVLLLVSFLVLEGAHTASSVWLSVWSNDAENNATATDMDLRNMRLGIYGLFGIVEAILVLFNYLLQAVGTYIASRNLHENLVVNLMRSPMQFFETTPHGRIINRLGKDIDTIDVMLPNMFRMFMRCLITVVVTQIIIAAATPLYLAAIPPLAIFYFLVLRWYISSSRQLKRLESISRSPIYSHFQESVVGASSIRAYQQQQLFIDEVDKRIDLNNTSWYPLVLSYRWLAIRLEFVGAMVIFSAALFAVVSRDTISVGIAGLSISYALGVTQTLNWLVRQSSELETNVVSVERVKEYSETPQEAPWEVPETDPGVDWPERGQVTFDKYALRYRDGLDLVLKDIDCDIQPGEKIGIVGRTGAGKSSLTVGLFRILESAGGSIKIDGVSIDKIGLHDLRSKLTIIPQEPMVFSGSLRSNLDPFENRSDDELWRALEHSDLKAFVKGLPDQLMFDCAEGGENISVGQRQLVCLARALLRKTKILILDEATAAVDLETDNFIQRTIKQEFPDCTILTIAHRLNTIMDSSRILVLDAGRIVEFDTPANLLRDEDSVFFSMAKDAGLY